MNGTPRLRSSYPQTPGADHKHATPPHVPRAGFSLPNLSPSSTQSAQASAPLIPVEFIDAPSQRMFATALYGLLLVLRLYDWWKLVEDETSSFVYFLKWTICDGIFLFGLPYLHIPWLEWSHATSTSFYMLHAVMNGILMFRIPVSSTFPNLTT